MPKRNIMSMRHTGLFAIALAQANISSVVVSPRPWTIFFEMKATMSPASSTDSRSLRIRMFYNKTTLTKQSDISKFDSFMYRYNFQICS